MTTVDSVLARSDWLLVLLGVCWGCMKEKQLELVVQIRVRQILCQNAGSKNWHKEQLQSETIIRVPDDCRRSRLRLSGRKDVHTSAARIFKLSRSNRQTDGCKDEP